MGVGKLLLQPKVLLDLFLFYLNSILEEQDVIEAKLALLEKYERRAQRKKETDKEGSKRLMLRHSKPSLKILSFPGGEIRPRRT